MNKIYLVEGSTGEYDDRCEWIVKAFISAAKAAEFVGACQKEADKLEKETPYHNYEARRNEKHSLDPYYRRDYTGVKYGFFDVELVE